MARRCAVNEDPRARFPRLLVCEGYDDKCFFHKMIHERDLPPFHIWPCRGNGGFSNAIRAFRANRTKQYNALRDILIVADNDDAPIASFSNVCDHIERFFGERPSAPLIKTKTKPAVSVLMIPWTDIHGHLEALCMESATDADRDVATHVQTFMNLLFAERWASASRRGKAWLRANLAARCDRDPFVPLAEVFKQERYSHLIPLKHKSFDRIARVLAGFADTSAEKPAS
jgi:hypothetical protein